MKSYLIAIGVSLGMWWSTRLFALPIDPFLICALLLGLVAHHHVWAVAAVGTLGLAAEALLLLPLGTVTSAYLLAFAIVGGVTRRLQVQGILARALWLAAAALVALSWRQAVYAGAVSWNAALCGAVMWHVAAALVGSAVLPRRVLERSTLEFPSR